MTSPAQEPFSDEDLKRLKTSLEAGSIFDLADFNVYSLLARMEAAEVIAQRHNIEHNPFQHDYEKDERRCEACRELKAWRTAKGVGEAPNKAAGRDA